MARDLSQQIRQLVAIRANQSCEYCLIPESYTFFGCEVDHIISLKHGGSNSEDNLAYSCVTCNRKKGSDLGSLLEGMGELIRFYNPRLDKWRDHFLLDGPIISPITNIGKVTENIFGFNLAERILERQELIKINIIKPA
jgi:hypothetical protein